MKNDSPTPRAVNRQRRRPGGTRHAAARPGDALPPQPPARPVLDERAALHRPRARRPAALGRSLQGPSLDFYQIWQTFSFFYFSWKVFGKFTDLRQVSRVSRNSDKILSTSAKSNRLQQNSANVKLFKNLDLLS